MSDDSVDKRYPLYWPEGWRRTPVGRVTWSRFKVSEGRARDEMVNEVYRLGGRKMIVSTNVELRLDGLPYAGRKDPVDRGVAVYFELDGKPITIACDQYLCVWENMRAIGKTIECLRGIQRYGASDLMERAFMGFAQLTYAPEPEWWQVLGVEHDERRLDTIRPKYRELASKNHPDVGGTEEQMKVINTAWQTAKETCKAEAGAVEVTA